jgi:hypothetical protein
VHPGEDVEPHEHLVLEAAGVGHVGIQEGLVQVELPDAAPALRRPQPRDPPGGRAGQRPHGHPVGRGPVAQRAVAHPHVRRRAHEQDLEAVVDQVLPVPEQHGDAPVHVASAARGCP